MGSKMLKYSLLIGLVTTLFLSGNLAAQSIVSGTLTDDKTNEPLIGAYLKLNTTIDTAVYFGVSDFEGNFSIEVLNDGDYIAEITYIGYAPIQKNFSVLGNTDLGLIALKTGSTLLGEIEVKALKERVKQIGDTTQYNAAAYGTNANATTEDLLQKMPGFVVTDGKMQVQGENVAKILVNGKPFFGDDPDMALKNLPAEVIAQIQVFDPSADDEENEDGGEGPKTINIILKPDYKDGRFGNIYGGYGDRERYKAGININFFKGDRRINILGQFNNVNQQNFSSADLLGISSARRKGKKKRGGASSKNFLVPKRGGINTTNAGGINYQNFWGKKAELSASYFYNQSDNINELLSFRDFFNTQVPYAITENSIDESTNTNHRFNSKFKYKFDDKNILTLIPALTIQDNLGRSDGETQTFSNDTITNTLSDSFSSNLSAINFANRLIFVHRFKKKKRLLNISLKNNFNTSKGSTFSNSTNLNSTNLETSVLDQNSILHESKQSYHSSIRMTEPFGKKGTIRVGYSFGNNQDESEILTSGFNLNSEDYDLLDESLSSRFNSDYLSHTGNLAYHFRTKKMAYKIHGNFQTAKLSNSQVFPTATQIDKNFNNFLPEFSFRYNYNKSKNLRLSFKTRTHLPKISDLQAVVDNSNPLRVQAGNPNLNQQVSNNFDIKFNSNNSEKGTVFFAFLKSNFYKDYIGRNLIIATKTDTLQGVVLQKGAQFRAPLNLSGYLNNRLFMAFGMPLPKLKSNFNINFGVNHKRIPSQIDGATFFTNTEKITTGLVLSSNISPTIDFTIKTTSAVDFAQNINTGNTNIFNQRTRATINYIFGENWQINSTITYQFFNTFGGNPIDNFLLWNGSFGYKFLKNNNGEIGLTLYDILDSNTAIQQFYGENSFTQKESLALTRYFMFTFRYNIRA